RGVERTPLAGDYDVVICGASFAGLAVARELTGCGARVLMIDRYEIGERQTSACGIPTLWMHALGLQDAIQQTFPSLLVHTPHGTVRWELPWSFSTFDYRVMCALLREQSPDIPFETAKVDGRTGDETRVGVGSFEPRFHVKEPTVRLSEDVERDPVRFQGNWIPHQIRAATGDGVFFVGDSAGHCLPTTAEGIRTALYFGVACGRELRAVVDGRRSRPEALERYHDFSRAHAWKFDWLLRVQWLGPRVPPRLLRLGLRVLGRRRLCHWAFER